MSIPSGPVTGNGSSGNTKMSVVDQKTGEVKLPQSVFRRFVSREAGAEFPPESGRYHLYTSLACPWASRCYMFLKLKGLEDVISMTVTSYLFAKTRQDPSDDHYGWQFASHEEEEGGGQPDTLNGAKFIRDLYDMVDPNANGRYTVPILWDKKKKTIVNNESAEIIRMFNDEFNEYAKHPAVNLFPAHLKSSINEVNSWTLNSINNCVYRCGFTSTQSAYNQAANELFDALDKCEVILSKQRYIAGNEFTEADVRLFVDFIRFDAVYFVLFKCSRKAIREYPNLFNYTKDIYQLPGIADTVDMDHIRQHFYVDLHMINKHGIVPLEPIVDYSAQHDRDRFSK